MSGRFSIEAFFKAVDGFSAPLAKMQANVKRFATNAAAGVKELNSGIDKVASGLKTAAMAAGAVGLVAGAAVIKLGSSGADFEQAMASLSAVSFKSRGEVKDLEMAARRFGTTTKFSGLEVVNAMELMGKAGADNNEILKATPGILSAAAAEGMGLSEATSAIFNTLKGMGLGFEESGRVADVLALAANRTSSSISSLDESMKNLAPVAHQFKIPLEQAIGMVALLQDVGLEASEAGTSTATMLTKIAKPTDDVAAKLKAMGVTFQNVHGDMLPPLEVLNNMSVALSKTKGNMKQVALFADLMGLRGQKAGLNLTEAFKTGKAGKLFEELATKAKGFADQTAALRLQNFKDQLLILWHTVEDLGNSLYDLAGPKLMELVRGMKGWVDANKEVLVQDVKGFLQNVSDNMGKIVQWAERIGKIVATFLGMAAAVKGISAAIWLVNAAMAANPVTLWVLAITAAVALLWAFWPEVKTFFAKVWTGIKDLASRVAAAVGAVLLGAWTPVKAFLLALLQFYVGLWTLLLTPLMPILRPVFEFLKSAALLVMSAWGPVSAFFSGLWDGAKVIFLEFAAFVVESAMTLVAKVQELWAPLGLFFSNLWQGISDTFRGALGWVIDKISEMIALVRQVGKGTLGALGIDTPEVAPPGGAAAAAPIRGVNSPPPTSSETNSTHTSKAEVAIVAAPGAAKITKPLSGGGAALRLHPSHAF